LTSLENINFGYNEITQLDANIFRGLVNIKNIDFVRNPIAKLDSHIFKHLFAENSPTTSSHKKTFNVHFKCDYFNMDQFTEWNYNCQRFFDEFFVVKSSSIRIRSDAFKPYVIMSKLCDEDESPRGGFIQINESNCDLDKYVDLKSDDDDDDDDTFLNACTPFDFVLRSEKIKAKLFFNLMARVRDLLKNKDISEEKCEVKLRDVKSIERLCKRRNEALMSELIVAFDCMKGKNVLDFNSCFKIALRNDDEGIAICLLKLFFTKYLSELIGIIVEDLVVHKKV
jgi:hypothetical protein